MKKNKHTTLNIQVKKLPKKRKRKKKKGDMDSLLFSK